MKLYTLFSRQMAEMHQRVFALSLAVVEPAVQLCAKSAELPGNGDFLSQGWLMALRAKASVLIEAADHRQGEIVGFCDTDIVFLRPFVAEAIGQMGDRDVLFQAEWPAGEGINSGVMFMRCSPALRNWLGSVEEALQRDPRARQQEEMQRMLPDSGLRWGVLHTLFSNASNGGLKPGSLLYHATETRPNPFKSSVRQKFEILTRAMEVSPFRESMRRRGLLIQSGARRVRATSTRGARLGRYGNGNLTGGPHV